MKRKKQISQIDALAMEGAKICAAHHYFIKKYGPPTEAEKLAARKRIGEIAKAYALDTPFMDILDGKSHPNKT